MDPRLKTPKPTLEQVARELLLSSKSATVRLREDSTLGGGLRAGDEVTVEQTPRESVKSGDLVGVLDGSSELPMVTEFIGCTGGPDDPFLVRDYRSPKGFARLGWDRFLGRVAAVRRQDKLFQVEPDASAPASVLAGPCGGPGERRDGSAAEKRVAMAKLLFQLNEELSAGRCETGDILITDACPLECEFCLYSCKREGGRMRPELAGDIARTYREAGVSRLRILGGEPFMFPGHLESCLERVFQTWPPDRLEIVTSGFWGTSAESARNALRPILANKGTSIVLSIDYFHLKKLSFDVYRHVIEACNRGDIRVTVNIHYCDELLGCLDRFVELSKTCRYEVTLSKVFPLGKAATLDDRLIRARTFDAFKMGLDDAGIQTQVWRGSCFRWCAAPSGLLYFCCMCTGNALAGDLSKESLESVIPRLENAFALNNRRIAERLEEQSDKAPEFICFFCPIRVDRAPVS